MGLVLYIYFGSEGIKGIVPGNFNLNSVRLICAIILHVTLIPEARSAFSLLRYIKSNPDEFLGGPYVPYIVAFMKYWVSLFAEVINIFIIVQSDNNIDVVKDYIALGIIAELDNLVLGTVEGCIP